MESHFAAVIIVAVVCYALVKIANLVMAFIAFYRLEKRKQQILAEIMASEDAELIARALNTLQQYDPLPRIE